MDKSTARTLVAGIVISLIAALGSVFIAAVRHSDGKTDDDQILEGHGTEDALAEFAAELAEESN